jgi:hypothetical protein
MCLNSTAQSKRLLAERTSATPLKWLGVILFKYARQCFLTDLLLMNTVVVLYGCETWSLKLREESRLRVYENRVLREILGSKREGVLWEWRKLHNDELNDLY